MRRRSFHRVSRPAWCRRLHHPWLSSTGPTGLVSSDCRSTNSRTWVLVLLYHQHVPCVFGSFRRMQRLVPSFYADSPNQRLKLGIHSFRYQPHRRASGFCTDHPLHGGLVHTCHAVVLPLWTFGRHFLVCSGSSPSLCPTPVVLLPFLQTQRIGP